MRLFGKKEESEESSNSDQDSFQSRSSSSGSTSRDVAIIQKDLETMKAMIGTLREMKKDDQEKFAKIGEQIGEMRNMQMTRERELKELGLKVQKAIDLVEAAQVEKVLVENKKTDARIQITDAKLESYHMVQETIISELKNIREKIGVFRGLEQVVKLNSEVKQDLTDMKYMRTDIERHADKIESMFIELNKKFDEFNLFKTDSEKLKDEIHRTLKEINRFNVQITQMVRKEDIASIEKEMATKLKSAEAYKDAFDKLLADVAKIKNEIAEERKDFTAWHAQMKEDLNVKTGFAATKAEIKKMETTLFGSMKRINKWITYFQDRLNNYEKANFQPREKKENPNDTELKDDTPGF